MNKFWTVFKFELGQQLKKKSFIITAVIIALVFFGATFLLRFVANETSPEDNTGGVESSEAVEESDKDTLALFLEGDVNESTLEALNSEYKVVEVDSLDSLKKMVKDEEVSEGLSLKSDLEGVVYTNSGFGNDGILEDILRSNYKYTIALPNEGIDPNKVIEIEQASTNIETEFLGRNTISGFVISYFVLMFLYFMIVMNGQVIASNVAKEKSNRTMELLITNVKPNSLILGKVLSGVVTSLLLFLILGLSLGAGLMINLGSSPQVGEMIKFVFSGIKTMDIVVLIVFALLGITLYYFMYAALGSLVSKLDELSQALAPITFLIIIAFIVPMFSLSNPESTVMRIASIVPFTSPLAMFSRYSMTNVANTELFLSMGLLLLTTIIFAILSIRIYRQGTLNYGNKLNLWKAMTQKID